MSGITMFSVYHRVFIEALRLNHLSNTFLFANPEGIMLRATKTRANKT